MIVPLRLYGRWANALRVCQAVGVAVLVTLIVVSAPAQHRVEGYVALSLCALGALGWLTGRQRLVTSGLFVVAAAGGMLASWWPFTPAIAWPIIAVLVAPYSLSLFPAVLVAVLAAVSTVVGHEALAAENARAHFIALAIAVAAGFLRGGLVDQFDRTVQLHRARECAAREKARVATLTERTRIAREIHDIQTHSLAALAVSLTAVDALLAKKDAGSSIRHHVAQAQSLARQGLEQTRAAVTALRAEPLDLSAELRALAEDYRDGVGDGATCTIDAELSLSTEVATTVYRCAQEAITNVRKHATGARVEIDFRTNASELILLVCNDIPSSATKTEDGFGLRGMRERVASVDGKMDTSIADGRWILRVRIPR